MKIERNEQHRVQTDDMEKNGANRLHEIRRLASSYRKGQLFMQFNTD